jgi:hypothetical protein
MDRCPFSLSLFHDNMGYYMKSTTSSGINEFHPHRDFPYAFTSHLNEEEVDLQEDMSWVHAKIVEKNGNLVRNSGCTDSTSMWKPIANERLRRWSQVNTISLLLNNLLDDTSIWTYANTVIEIERSINIIQ